MSRRRVVQVIARLGVMAAVLIAAVFVITLGSAIELSIEDQRHSAGLQLRRASSIRAGLKKVT